MLMSQIVARCHEMSRDVTVVKCYETLWDVERCCGMWGKLGTLPLKVSIDWKCLGKCEIWLWCNIITHWWRWGQASGEGESFRSSQAGLEVVELRSSKVEWTERCSNRITNAWCYCFLLPYSSLFLPLLAAELVWQSLITFWCMHHLLTTIEDTNLCLPKVSTKAMACKGKIVSTLMTFWTITLVFCNTLRF